MIDRPPDEPTVASKTILLFKVADCLRRFFEAVREEPTYAHCLEADQALRSIILDGPVYLKADPSGLEGFPSWTSNFRAYWVISISHKLLVVHRMFSGPANGDEPHAYSRRVVIEAARSIIQQLAQKSASVAQSYWTVSRRWTRSSLGKLRHTDDDCRSQIPWHTMSAATTIMLDIFQSPGDPDVPNKRAEVEQALAILQQLAPGSHIAARGVRLLSTLLGEEAKHRQLLDEIPRADQASGSAYEDGDFGHIAKRARTSVRGRTSSSRLPGHSPSLASTRAPFFHPTMGPPSATSSPGLSLPPLMPGPSGATHEANTAPLSQEALEALFQGLGGGLAQSVPHEPPLAFAAAEGPYALPQEQPLDLWTLLGAAPGEGDDCWMSFGNASGLASLGSDVVECGVAWPAWSG